MILSVGTEAILRSPGHTHDGEKVTVEYLYENGKVLIRAQPPGSKHEITVVRSDELFLEEAQPQYQLQLSEV